MRAALAYTRELGWHLIPDFEVRAHFHRPKPRWRYSADETARRMHEQGYSPEHIARTINKLSPVEETDAVLLRPEPRLLREGAELAQAGAEDPGRLAG